MDRHYLKNRVIGAAVILLLSVWDATAQPLKNTTEMSDDATKLLEDLSTPTLTPLEALVAQKNGMRKVMRGVASYYTSRFAGRLTTSGHRYNPDKMTAAHHNLPLGTVVKVVNPETNEEVHVTVNDRCAYRPFHFIDLSRAAAQKIGLWGKGKMQVVIIPLLGEPQKEPS